MIHNLERGILYLVATPIGNLEDITLRAIRILKEVDLIAAEDTRHTKKLLQHFSITTRQISYHQHSNKDRLNEIIEKLTTGLNIALVSDAGMPGISDPGYNLIRMAIEMSIQVVTIPGVSASITALVSSGLPTDRFVFEGFLPTKKKFRQDRFSEIKTETRTIILYEAPHRLLTTLQDLATVLGNSRSIVLGRELTKIHEELWRGNIKEAIDYYKTGDRKPKGEYTIIISGAILESNIRLSETQIKEEFSQLLSQGMTRSQASRYLAELTNLSRREIYKLTIDS